MLPYSTDNNDLTTSRKVYINPNFNVATQLGNQQQQQQLQMMIYQQQQQLAMQQQQQRQQQQGHFVYAQPLSIHINPHFLKKQQEQLQIKQQNELQRKRHFEEQYKAWEQAVANINVQTPPPPPPPQQQPKPLVSSNTAKIISKASTKLVRNTHNSKAKPINTSVKTTLMPAATAVAPLISINKRKLVRQSNTEASVKNAIGNQIGKPLTVTAITNSSTVDRCKYKIDRVRRKAKVALTPPQVNICRKRTFIGRYALRRVTDHVINKKLSTAKIVSMGGGKSSSNRTLQLLNINGVLYKSTRNKLQRKISTSTTTTANKTSKNLTKSMQSPTKMGGISGRTLFVRGTKFVMDAKGFKLTRTPGHSTLTNVQTSPTKTERQRIDIAGLTYIAAPNQNVFVRTTNHVYRAHLLNAKQRSLQLLNRSHTKTNIPCAIYQRLGKCAAHERGKCRKVHDRRQVAICPSFLRGECAKFNCLLSHNVTLAKMPVCKFYLQALCNRDDCPYLHKKLSEGAEICIDFLRGYCSLAEKCNKRHEFLCPEYESKGKCNITNCLPCAQQVRRQKLSIKQKILGSENEENCEKSFSNNDSDPITRYFDAQTESKEIRIIENNINSKDTDGGTENEVVQTEYESDTNDDNDDDDDAVEEVLPKYKNRAKLGPLPSFIPLS